METIKVKIKYNRGLDRSRDKKSSESSLSEGCLVFNLPNVEILFLSLNIKNQSELIRVGKSFIADIENGKKQFAFKSLIKKSNERYVLACVSLINYSLKKQVLIIVKDLLDEFWNQYGGNFSEGTLCKWKSLEWGDLCFIDFNQINKEADSLNRIDFNTICNEFYSVLWSLPEGNLNNYLPKNTIKVLDEIDSITVVMSKGHTKIKENKSCVEYFQCFEVPLKGILMEEKV